MERSDRGRFSELDLIRLLEQIIERDPSFESRTTTPRIGDGGRVDLLLERHGAILIVEVKRVAPQTRERLDDMLEQVGRYKNAVARQFPGRPIQLVLAIPGVLTPDRMEAVAAARVELWDQRWMISHGRAVGLDEELKAIFGDALYDEPVYLSRTDLLQVMLSDIACGRAGWYAYQKVCGEILEYLFCPPLKTPIPESSNIPRINRRDFVVPNYVPDEFWHFMRLHYRADYIVVDAKNHCGQANKTHVLQLANYLSPHGTGLFGMIVTRNGMDRGGMYTCREQWMLHSKMIITLNDDDLRQMLENKKSGLDPEDVVRQKIEDFRLGM
jgi:hypothetical protein